MTAPTPGDGRGGVFWRESLLAFGPHAGSHRVAIRATISTAVPLVLLLLIGRPEWAPWAAFGAFAALYGRNRVHLSRLTMQLTAAAVLVAMVGLGSLLAILPAPTWPMIVAGAALAGVISIISDAEDWHPPGPLFALFAFSGSASLPDGTLADAGTATLVAAASAAFAVLVGSAGTAMRRARGLPTPRGELSRDWTLRAGRRVQLRRVARYAIGVLLAGTIAVLLGIGHPYWAMVSALVPVSTPTFAAGVVRGTHRILGTTLGVVLAAGLLALQPSALWVVVLIVAFTFGAELLVGRNYGIAMICITPLALLAVHLATPTPPEVLLVDRLVESAVGALVGVVVGFATRGWGARAA
ncbi:FUSC family protein [Agrococcus baldri]|uniref:FUSC family protein n=1 Tax=Agrococcus baldri TaxID=153730 RepID=A0AA87RA80_9MICO|nr:FUSC family protein [Agrococcus baldri]GEK78952.1 FUSC family protein [Agrococcus baldri]